MRLANIEAPDGRRLLARLEGDKALPIAPAASGPGRDPLRDALADDVDLTATTGPAWTLADCRLLAPVIAPQKVLAIGLNYADHAREAGAEVPKAPVVFAKMPSSIVGPRQAIVCRTADSAQVDYEAELAVVIGRRTRDASIDDALGAVLGYTACNDVSARDAQFSDGQWVRSKSFDTFCPLGPWIVTADEIPDPQALGIRCRVNGTTLQDSSTAEMIFGVAHLVSYLSRVMVLEPGDVIATGTPAGVGFARRPPIFLADGDEVEVEIDGIGILTNSVRVTS